MSRVSVRDRSRTSTSKTRFIVVGGAITGLALTACAPALNLATVPWTESQAVISASMFGEKQLTFDETPTVSGDNGRIDSVTGTSAKGGVRVGGKLDEGGTAWVIDTSDLEFGTKYKVSAKAVDLRGKETVTTGNFKTFVPEKQLTVDSNVWDGSTYGVGMPIVLNFSEAVLNRADVEQRLEVSTNKELPVEGRWSWDSDTQVTYRPKEYWPAKTKVKLNASLKGVNAGGGAYAMENTERNFTIGSKQVMLIDDNSKQLTFRRNGKVLQRMPVSMGKPGHTTRSGIKVIMSKERNVIFTADVAESDPEYYRIPIAIAMRVTWSGEYIHSAPWSVGSQGYSNVSHGCTNVSTGNAEWLIQNSNIGDIAEYRNTGRGIEPGNGITVWNESWKDWKAGSAL